MCPKCGCREFRAWIPQGQEAVVHIGRNHRVYVDKMRFFGQAATINCTGCGHSILATVRSKIVKAVMATELQTAW